LIVRGMCSLIPGIKGISENITAISIIDRFLEHPRVAVFENNGDNDVYISSADWMPRNLMGRVETLVPIENKTIHRQILEQILVANINDNQQSWLLKADGSYERNLDNKSKFSVHEYFMKYPSLSGQGNSLRVKEALVPQLMPNKSVL